MTDRVRRWMKKASTELSALLVQQPSVVDGSVDVDSRMAAVLCETGRLVTEQTDDAELAACFAPLAAKLAENEATINAELIAVQGKPADIGGYYLPKADLVGPAMRPSATLNGILAEA